MSAFHQAQSYVSHRQPDAHVITQGTANSHHSKSHHHVQQSVKLSGYHGKACGNNIKNAINKNGNMVKSNVKNSMIALSLLLGMGLATNTQANVAQVHEKTCATCHDSGALGAPKTGDSATWQRLQQEKGMDKLVQAVKEGKSRMPAGGLCSQCSEQDFRQLIEHMSQ